jgi:hypothetical protein
MCIFTDTIVLNIMQTIFKRPSENIYVCNIRTKFTKVNEARDSPSVLYNAKVKFKMT